MPSIIWQSVDVHWWTRIRLHTSSKATHKKPYLRTTKQVDNPNIVLIVLILELERQTEDLSHLLENEMDFKNLDIWKQRIIDKSKHVDQRRLNLLDQVFDGNKKRLWAYNESN